MKLTHDFSTKINLSMNMAINHKLIHVSLQDDDTKKMKNGNISFSTKTTSTVLYTSMQAINQYNSFCLYKPYYTLT